jgi:tRNA(Ile)-lysidine synthase
MLKQFQNQLKQLHTTPGKHRFLIAASGGLDSTVLIHLCHQLKLNFGICHVNFQLRGKDSDGDQKFLEDLAKKLERPLFALSRNAKEYAEEHQLSTQVAARQIRYSWFEKCLNDHNFDHLLTAHHADDDLETYLINSFRGTGIKGLTGIPEKRDYILRPLLKFTRKEILSFAKNEHLKWREDLSNAEDKYLRNVIRHHLLPFFEQRKDNLYARFETTQNNLNRQESLLEDYMHLIFKQVAEEKKESYHINIKKLKQFPNPEKILTELLKDFGFTDWDSLTGLMDTQVGKYISSSTHRLVRERGFLELFQLKEHSAESIHVSLENLPKTIHFDQGVLFIETSDSFEKSPHNFAFLSKDLLKSDLCLRPYKKGDYFCPLGMKGKRKLSDFLKDEKLSTFEKSKIWVLTHQKEIIWVINHRIDNRYKITENTRQCLKIEFSPY